MVIGVAKNWASTPRIYIENVRDRDPAYQVTSADVARGLSGICDPVAVTCRFSDDPDVDLLRQADVLIAGVPDIKLLAAEGSGLKLIQLIGAGVENLSPFDWLSPTTTLTNASGVHAEKASEFGLMAALMLHERVPWIATNQRHHAWKRQLRGVALGSRVLIYGVGALGSAVAARLKAVGFHITGIRRSGEAHPAVAHMTTPDHFHEELRQTDILILTCPLTSETRDLLGDREVGLLPKGAAVLNIARAGVVNHPALARALESGHLSGAILDVFEREPLPEDDSLWEVPNLMIFPHISSSAPERYIDRCLSILADNIKRAKSNQPFRNIVDPVLGY